MIQIAINSLKAFCRVITFTFTFVHSFIFTFVHSFTFTLVFIFILNFIFIFASILPAAADSGNSKKNGLLELEAIELKPISITADKFYDPVWEPSVIPLNNKSFTETITRKTIELRNPANAVELISFISPAVLSSKQNRKYKSLFDVRGSKASVILDGFVVQDGGSNSGVRGDDRLLDFLNPDIIESADIIKDSTALIYGGAKGGVIYIKTGRPSKKRNKLKLELGTFGEFITRLSLSDVINNKTAYHAAFNYKKFDGPESKNANSTNIGAYLKFFYTPGGRDDLSFTFSRDGGMYQIPVDEPEVSGQFKLLPEIKTGSYSIVIDPRYGWSFEPWTSVFNDLNYLKKWNGRQSTNIQLSRLETTNVFHNPRNIGATPAGQASSQTDGHRVFETTSAMAVRHTIKTGGGIIYRTGYTVEHWYNPSGKLYWENMNNEDKKHTMYLQAEAPLAGERLVLDAGFRRDRRYIIREQKSRAPANKIIAAVTDRWEDPRNSFSTGITYKPSDRDSLSLRYASLIMTPVDRLASKTGEELINEKDSIINFAIAHKFKNTSKPSSVELNLFRNEMKNSIIDDGFKFIDAPANTTVVKIFKNACTTSKGGEINFKAKLNRFFEISAGAGLISYSADITTKPRRSYISELKYTNAAKAVNASLYARFAGGFDSPITFSYKDASNKTITESLNSYKLGGFLDAGFSVSKKLYARDQNSPKLTLSVRNIFDKRYETVPMAPDCGRRASVGYEIDF